jgi:hypothetical protein
MTTILDRPWAALSALALGLALLTSACANSSSSGGSSDTLFDDYDSDGDNTLQRTEWDRTYDNMDHDGDGVVARDEFNAAVGGGFGGGGRR